MKCEKCGREFKENKKDKAFEWKGKAMCQECLVGMGGSVEDALTWEAFLHSEQNKPAP